MYINSNQLSMMTNNKMKQTQSNLQKAIEKLTSGKKINSASDDAAGLAISQKLLALKRGSHQAIRNVQDANSLVQTADSAMQEMSDIVHRIRELTVQAMNGTNTDIHETANADTLIIQNEIDELKKSLNDIVKGTEFNTKKLLTNIDPGGFIYEDRVVSKTLHLSSISKLSTNSEMNNVGYNDLDPVVETPDITHNLSRSTTYTTIGPKTYIGTTVADQTPRWSADGESVVFSSTRDGGSYIVSIDGNDPVANTDTTALSQKIVSSNGELRLRNSSTLLYLERKIPNTNSWTSIASYSYNTSNGSAGYSFSPNVDTDGNTSFVYSDNEGNIKKVDVNQATKSVGGATNLITTTDELNLPPTNNTLVLPNEPDLYRMNTNKASFRIQKEIDGRSIELTYLENDETPTDDGYYYKINGNEVTFYGKAIIGSEEGIDDAQDYYRFSYVSDAFQNNVYTVDIPSNAEVYNMHGEDGPRSLNITVGGNSITQSHLLDVQPENGDETTGVYVNKDTGKIEFYGDLRPAYNQYVRVEYMTDYDSRNEVQTVSFNQSVDTYNLTDTDPTSNRSLRVYVDGNEVFYDESKTDGFTFEDGKIHLYGDSRPDISGSGTVQIEYVRDESSTDREVYGIKLDKRPEVYNLGSEDSPNSIRVFRNGTEIDYSDTDGYQYNQSTNTIELFGDARPEIGDSYSIQMVVPTGDVSKSDGKVEILLSHSPETYDEDNPITFKVIVDGTEVSYDATKTNGFYYNSGTKKIELYGDARPDANNSSEPDVKVYYVYESPITQVENDSYDFRLPSTTLDYGVESESEPRAIRVYKDGVEVPYDAEDGFTYDPALQRVSLHGAYRPTKDDDTGTYDVYAVKSSDLKQTLPENAYIYKVILNGNEIDKAEDSLGNGYLYNGSEIEVIGDARTNITNSTYYTNLNVQYFDSLEVNLDAGAPSDFFHNYCEHESGHGMMNSEIDPSSIQVYMDGSLLNTEQYSLENNKILLHQKELTLGAGNHEVSVEYTVKQGTDFDVNDFIFQTGANAGQNYKLEINSFDNMLRNTSVICVRDLEDATKALDIIDNAQQFILEERGGIGATQNRLKHISSTLQVTEENTVAALSRIADTDMAKESMNLVRQQILTQAQQAMAAHVNQRKEQVLQLL